MKKRIFAFLCTAILMFCTVSAMVIPASADIESVDYSRIEGTGGFVIMKLGSLEFVGEMSRGAKLSRTDIDKIVKQTMNDLNITSGMLANAKNLLEIAKNTKKFDPKELGNLALKLVNVDTMMDLYNMIMADDNATDVKTPEQIIEDKAVGKVKDYAKKEMGNILTKGGKIALKGAGKVAFKFVFVLPDLAETGLNSLQKYEKYKEVTQTSLERQALIERFYSECNERIKKASGSNGDWAITFKNSSQFYNCTFWGASGNMVEARLSGRLDKLTGNGFDGEYSGNLTLELENIDFSPVLNNLINSNGLSQIKGIMKQAGGFNQTGKPSGTISLRRTISGNVTVTVSEMSGVQTVDVSGFGSGEDTTEFSMQSNMTFARSNVSVTTLDVKCNSSSIDTVQYTANSVGSFQDYVNEGSESGTGKQDIGTIWAPIESTPKMIIYLDNR